MTQCTCSCLSPFRWQSHPRPSIFLTEPGSAAFTPRNTKGQSTSQIASEAAERFQRITGRSLGSIEGLTAASVVFVKRGKRA